MTNYNITLLILAGGLGRRYQSLKQIDGIGPDGEFLFEYAIYDAIQSGFRKIVVVVNKSVEKVLEGRLSTLKKIVDIQLVIQETKTKKYPTDRTKPWGTAHAVLSARSMINEPFMVLNADDYYGRLTVSLGAQFLKNKISDLMMGMVAFPLLKTLSKNGPVSRGFCETVSGSILKCVQEFESIEKEDGIIRAKSTIEKHLEPNTLVSMNCWLFSPLIFDYFQDYFDLFYQSFSSSMEKEFYLPQAVQKLIDEEGVQFKVLESNDQWFGLTYEEDRVDVKNKLNQFALELNYPKPLFI